MAICPMPEMFIESDISSPHVDQYRLIIGKVGVELKG